MIIPDGRYQEKVCDGDWVGQYNCTTFARWVIRPAYKIVL